jgi:hypothetical protein
MVISFFLCLGGYGQAAQILDRVSFTVVGVDFYDSYDGPIDDSEFIYDDVEMESLIGQTLNLFIVVYDDASEGASFWNNDNGGYAGPGNSLDPSYMTFMSDASYLLAPGLLRLLDVFNFVQPSYPFIRQVYGHELHSTPTTVYDYVFWEGEGSGFLFDYTPDDDQNTYGTVTLCDSQGNKAKISFVGDQDSVQRVIIRRPALPAKAKAPNPLPIGGIR